MDPGSLIILKVQTISYKYCLIHPEEKNHLEGMHSQISHIQ